MVRGHWSSKELVGEGFKEVKGTVLNVTEGRMGRWGVPLLKGPGICRVFSFRIIKRTQVRVNCCNVIEDNAMYPMPPTINGHATGY